MQNEWFFIIFFSFADNNQNSRDKFTNMPMHMVGHDKTKQIPG